MSSSVPHVPRVEAGGDRSHATSLGARTLGGIGWSSLTVAIKAALTLLVLAVLSRLLTPNDFGLVGIVWILMEVATRFGQTGIGHALIQRPDLTDAHVGVGFTLSVTLGVAVAAAAWLFAPSFSRLFNEPATSSLLRVLCVAFVIGGVSVVPEHLLRRHLRFKELMVADLLPYAVGYGLTATVLAFRGLGAWAIIWAEIVRVLIRTVIAVLYSPARLRPRLTTREAADLVSPGTGYSFMQVFDFIVRTGGAFVVGRWLGATSLGYYTRADRLASLPFQYLGAHLFEVAFPAMAQRRQRVDLVGVAYLRGVEILLLAVLPVSILTFVSAPGIVAVVLGEQWDEAVPVLRVLALAIPFQTCGILNVAAVRASGAVFRETWRHAVHAFLVAFGAWLGSRWGVTGVAAAIVGAQIVACLLMTQAALSLLGLRAQPLLRCCLPALWASAWAGLALWLTAGPSWTWAPPAGLALLCEVLVWMMAVVGATYYAPPVACLLSLPWVLESVPFDAMGKPGRYLRSGLERLPSVPDPCAPSSLSEKVRP